MLRFTYEMLGAGVLLSAALFALAAIPRDLGRLSLWAGLGTVWLTIDEVLGVHESFGRMAYEDWHWGDPPLVNHWDDVATIVTGLVGLIVVIVLRKEVLQTRTFARWFGAGLALFAAAVVWDATASTKGSASWYTEETLELLGACCMALAFFWRFRWLPRNRRVPAPVTLFGEAAEAEM